MCNRVIKGKYELFAGNYDWGCGIDHALICLEEAIDNIKPGGLSVKVRMMKTDMTSADYPLKETVVERKVTSSYLCDEDGKEVEGPSAYLMLDLYVSPEEGSPLVFTSKTQIFVWSDPYDLQITYHDEEENISLEIDPKTSKLTTAADVFDKKEYTSPEGIYYPYACYSPEEKTDTLFVWLHGLGEGQIEGSNVYLPLLGRKGCTMAGEAFQSAIGYAHVLVPQCPTYWMDEDGKQSNFGDCLIHASSKSYYTESLAAFIESYAKEVGARKIVLAGCSNGGFMSLVLAMNYPDRYAAVVPICEAVPDESITDEMIERLIDVPLYFVYSKNDPIVDPTLHEIPTIARLKKAGCRNLHVSETEKVMDTSGLYKKEDGSPYEYMGHLSWIYYDNNETADENGLSAWEWIADCLKN